MAGGDEVEGEPGGSGPLCRKAGRAFGVMSNRVVFEVQDGYTGTLRVWSILTRGREAAALIENLGVELTPHQARKLADALLSWAASAEDLHNALGRSATGEEIAEKMTGRP